MYRDRDKTENLGLNFGIDAFLFLSWPNRVSQGKAIKCPIAFDSGPPIYMGGPESKAIGQLLIFHR
jgi:hypothetical protein